MALKRTVLAMIVVLVATGFTAGFSALTSAGESGWWWWYDHDVEENPMPSKPKTVEPEGDLTITVAGLVTFGPCEGVRLDGELFNDPMGNGEGEVLEAKNNGQGCETNLPGCEVVESRPTNLPWSIKLESATEVTINGVAIETHLSEECNKKYKLPLTSVTTGNVKARFQGYDPEKEGYEFATFVFEESGELTTMGMSATLDGFFLFGTNLTSEFIPI